MVCDGRLPDKMLFETEQVCYLLKKQSVIPNSLNYF